MIIKTALDVLGFLGYGSDNVILLSPSDYSYWLVVDGDRSSTGYEITEDPDNNKVTIILESGQYVAFTATTAEPSDEVISVKLPPSTSVYVKKKTLLGLYAIHVSTEISDPVKLQNSILMYALEAERERSYRTSVASLVSSGVIEGSKELGFNVPMARVDGYTDEGLEDLKLNASYKTTNRIK